MKNIKTKLLMGLLAFSAFNMSHGATSTATMQVTATVEGACSITTTNMHFGAFQLGQSSGTLTFASASVDIKCAEGVQRSVKWDGGLHYDGFSRRMKHSTLNEYLNYELDLGDGMGLPPNGNPLPGQGEDLGRQVIGTLDRSQVVTPGNYSDAVTVTIEY